MGRVKLLEKEKSSLYAEILKLKDVGELFAAGEKVALEEKVKNLGEALVEDRLMFETQRKEIIDSNVLIQEKLENAKKMLIISGKRIEELESAKGKVDKELAVVMDDRDEVRRDAAKVKNELDKVVEELSTSKKDYDILGERFDAAEKEIKCLKWKLEIAPDRESVLEDFRQSTELQKMLKEVGERFIGGFMDSSSYKEKLDGIVRQFMKSTEFQRSVGEKTKHMVPYLFECCRVYFKYDLQRP